MSETRVVVWFSCGVASAVAAKLAIEKYGGDRCAIVYCDMRLDEHPDNARFLDDVSTWIGKQIELIKSEKYDSIGDVFRTTRYMSGPSGARCTVEMKKIPRFNFQKAEDVHIYCIGCVKASSPRYWNMVRKYFPSIFMERARQSRDIGCKLTRINGRRAFLDDLPVTGFDQMPLESISCGPECSQEPKREE